MKYWLLYMFVSEALIQSKLIKHKKKN